MCKLTSCPLGMCNVFGPVTLTNLFTNRILANVPLAMISSFPRLEPYELKSLGVMLKNKIVFYSPTIK